MKYDWKFKLKCVEKYMEGRWIEKPDHVSCSDERFRKTIRQWVRIYERYGVEGLKHKLKNKGWTAEEISSDPAETDQNQWWKKPERYGGLGNHPADRCKRI